MANYFAHGEYIRPPATVSSEHRLAGFRPSLRYVMIAGVTAAPSSTRRGFLNPLRVITFAFWTTTLCILVAVVASILAIWQFTGTDALWRTVATCAVIGGGTLAFAWVNSLFGIADEQ
jgi:hypothetical protein